MWRRYWRRNFDLSIQAWDTRATIIAIVVAILGAVAGALGSYLDWIPTVLTHVVTGLVSGAGLLIVVVLILALFVTPVRMWATMEAELTLLRARSNPQLDIVFDRELGRPYIQDRRTVAGQDHFVIQRQIRVGVRNLSDRLITSVHVVLESCEPASDYVYPGHALRQQGSRGEFFDVSPGDGPTVYVDVLVCLMRLLEWDSIDPVDVEDLHLCYVENLMARLPIQDHTLVLRVEGGGTFKRRTFQARVAGPALDFVGVDAF